MKGITADRRFIVRCVAVATLLCAKESAGFMCSTIPMRRSIGSGRPATIFAPSWEEEGFSNYGLDEKEKNTPPFSLMETLSRDQGVALARLAAAFSPVGHHLVLKDIDHVTVITIDENHIDIQAVICEDEGCVTIAVPVSFPRPCASIEHGMEECVMDNLGWLDIQASEKLQQMELDLACYEARQKCWRELTSEEKINLPTWWVSPKQMSDECDNVRRLLNNEGFQPDVKALATQILMTVDGDESFVVEQAAIAAVCPTGIYLRARAKLYNLFQGAEEKIVEIPVAFGHEAKDIATLRLAILRAVTTGTSSNAGINGYKI